MKRKSTLVGILVFLAAIAFAQNISSLEKIQEENECVLAKAIHKDSEIFV